MEQPAPQQVPQIPPPATPHAEQAMDDPEAPPVVAVDFDSLPYQWIGDHEKKIGDLIREFRKEEGLRRPAPEKVEKIVSILKEMVGGDPKLPELLQDLENNKKESVYYDISKDLYRQLIKKTR